LYHKRLQENALDKLMSEEKIKSEIFRYRGAAWEV
jgi:hypothetical protein